MGVIGALNVPGSERRHYIALDSLRGYAALVVLIYHALLMFPYWDNLCWHDGLQASEIGRMIAATPLRLLLRSPIVVYLFFLLSGLAMAFQFIDGRRQSYGAFLTRRFTRIYLPYIASIGLSYALFAIVGHAKTDGVSNFYDDMWVAPFERRTIVDAIVLDARHATMNLSSWSVSWELGISLVFPLLMAPFARWRRKGLLLSLALCAVLCLTCRIFGAQAADLGRKALAYLFLFLSGAFIASYLVERRAAFSRTALVAASVCSVVLFLWQGSRRPLMICLPVACAAVIVIGVAMRDGGFSRVLHAPISRWFAKISFSLYLVHLPLMTAVIAAHRMDARASIILGAALSIPVALVFHRFVESPSQQFGRRLSPGQRLAIRPIEI